ncbi:MAG TPA: PRC-barrel domain-containing protein [Gaiellaceae bacterium]|nr:PRC-barrel domain-containing protein [Gaiellaceae bacterium]
MSAEPQVSWKALERGAAVVAADGSEVGKVAQVVGDVEADIFNGLVVSLGFLDRDRYLPAERVTGIWSEHVEVDAGPGELERLPAYEEQVSARIQPAEGGFLTRLRRFFR